MANKSSWRKLLGDKLRENGEAFSDVVSCTLNEAELDVVFDTGYVGAEGAPFTVWTTNRVYFPTVYDGAEWVSSVSRNPDGKPTEHVGGG